MVKMIVWSIWFRLCGILLCPFLNIYCLLKGMHKYPEWAYTLDNDEDGFTGDKRGWYSNYLGFDVKSKPLLYRWYRSIRWCWRNQAFNHRIHPKCSVDVTNPEEILFEGNTHHHEPQWSFNHDVVEIKWYKVKLKIDGVWYKSEFRLTPLGDKEWLFKRKGLKIYPFFYLDDKYGWKQRVIDEGFPPYKDRAVYASSRRKRKYKM